MNIAVKEDIAIPNSDTEQKRHQKYYLNLPEWPEFNIYDGTKDGVIPSCRVKNWQDFDRVVQHYCSNDVEGRFVFRGQKHYSWKIEPTLGRLETGVNSGSGAVSEDIAIRQLENFRLATRGRLQDKSVLQNDNELWALGQHHGLATPLLDWSASPFVAMFFAFQSADDSNWVDEEGNSTNYSRTIFVLNKQFLKDLAFEKALDFDFPEIVEPAIDDHGRLVNQAGLFTIAPYGETLESSLINALQESGVDTDDIHELAKYICRIHIPNEKSSRTECLQKLRKMNIHDASLFPDLIGASGYCNGLINEVIRKITKLKSDDKGTEDSNPLPSSSGLSVSSWNTQKISDDLLKELTEVLGLNTQVTDAVKPEQMSMVVKNLIQFVNEQAGIDWYKRESELARLRLKVRRDLKKQQYPEDWLNDAADALITKAAELSEDIEVRSQPYHQIDKEDD